MWRQLTGVSYNRLWKMLIDKNMKRIEMQYFTGISGNILARMGKNSMYRWRRLRRYTTKNREKAFVKNRKDRGYEKGDSQIFWQWYLV